MRFDLKDHLERQWAFSERTFGPGMRTKGVCEHIAKELVEIQAAPTDVEEWIDVIILGFDGALRSGATPDTIISTLVAKQTKNESRDWPDWRVVGEDHCIEHLK